MYARACLCVVRRYSETPGNELLRSHAHSVSRVIRRRIPRAEIFPSSCRDFCRRPFRADRAESDVGNPRASPLRDFDGRDVNLNLIRRDSRFSRDIRAISRRCREQWRAAPSVNFTDADRATAISHVALALSEHERFNCAVGRYNKM